MLVSSVMLVLLQERVRVEETQTPAQRQAAAKLALRKQLEKTLLQVSNIRCVLYFSPSGECSYPNTAACGVSDPSPKTTPTGDALHPEPIEHRVHLPAWIGARCRLHHQGPEDPTPARRIQMLTVPNRLYTCVEVGEESNQR